MTRKILYVTGSVLALAFLVIIFVVNLPAASPYIAKKVTRGQVEVAKIDYRYDKGQIIVKLTDLKVRGGIEGTVKQVDLVFNLMRRPFFKSSTISDFDLTVSGTKRKTRFFSMPADLLSIETGCVTYNKHKFIVDRIAIQNLRPGKPFRFALAMRSEYDFENLTATGEGTYRQKLSDFRGTLQVTGFDLARRSPRLKGMVTAEGPFTFSKRRFRFEGPAVVSGFVLTNPLLRKPLTISRYAGPVVVTYESDRIDIAADDIVFRNTPFILNLRVEKGNLAVLDLTSGFVDIKDVKGYVALDGVVRGSSKLWDSIPEGKVKITKFHYERKKSLNAELELKDVGFLYNDMHFDDIAGFLRIDGHKVTVSRGQGAFRSSRFHDAAGTVSLTGDKEVRVKGNYSVNLVDIPYVFETGAIRFQNGTTQGVAELQGSQKTGYKASGAGRIRDANVAWQKMSVSARGSYRFLNDEISFDPLVVNRGGTDMVIRGKWNKKSVGVFLKGNLDIDHIKPFAKIPLETEGIAGLDLDLQKNEGVVTVNGTVATDDLSFRVPGVVAKKRGLNGTAYLTARIEDKTVDIEHLSYDMEGLHLDGTGDVGPDKTMNLDVGMNINGIERVAPLFFFENGPVAGDAEVKVSLRDLNLPLKKLPYVRGFVTMENGSIQVPWIRKPLKKADLVADFKGDVYDIRVKNLSWGQSALRSGRLHIEGAESPRFLLSLDMDRLDFADFQGKAGSKIRTIPPDGFMARTTGDVTLRVREISFSRLTGTDLRIRGTMGGRKLTISHLGMNAFGGYAGIQGDIDLSGPVPAVSMKGKVSQITGGHFLRAMGAESSVIDGEGVMVADLSARGENSLELTNTLHGQLSVYTHDGVIRKWNLLSKLFGILNVYDLFRGKVPLTESGLSYNKMGATFKVANGVFSTNNFVLDSPSMLITGAGDVNAAKREIQGTINVSPLVAIDRVIDKIPIVRSILRERHKGFLYGSYSVKGPIDDPYISLNFVNTIGGRTIDILRNILVLPAGIFERQEPPGNDGQQ
ncbi:MAG: putative assembly protein [Syntrophorhabdus sp. PtaU1.Bin153]|nr:MAG: putative assembly protein [Syntrophorhabdus sp. PtaU1.Bin153]